MLRKSIVVGRAPAATSPSVVKSMRANRGVTKLEQTVKRLLREAGFSGYRGTDVRLPGKPDLVFPRQKVAVFVHGCFWHRCGDCAESLPKSNRAFWSRKFQANRLRDRRNIRDLKARGWTSVILWECYLSRKRGRKLANTLAHLADVLRPNPKDR